MWSALRELFTYRALIQTLVMRDLKSRYRGSTLGLLWTTLNPLLHMGIYALIFSTYMRMGMERYGAFLLCGLLPWIWFSSSLLMGSTAIVEGGHLLKKVFFPAHVLPTVTVIANFVNFLLGLPILFAFLLLYGVALGWAILALPLIIGCQFAFTLGITLLVSTMSIHYRDIPQILTHLLTFWFLLSPIVYPASQIPERFQVIVSLNPVAWFLIAYQNALLYNGLPSLGACGTMLLASACMLLGGLLVLVRFRWSFAEEL